MRSASLSTVRDQAAPLICSSIRGKEHVRSPCLVEGSEKSRCITSSSLMLVGIKLSAAVVVLLVMSVGAAACGKEFGASTQAGSLAPEMTIEEAIKQHTDRLLSLPGVVGTAIGACEGRPCIKVLVVKKTPELLNKIPSTLEGFPVAVEETGPIRALDGG